jgi:hypothetical protein
MKIGLVFFVCALAFAVFSLVSHWHDDGRCAKVGGAYVHSISGKVCVPTIKLEKKP